MFNGASEFMKFLRTTTQLFKNLPRFLHKHILSHPNLNICILRVSSTSMSSDIFSDNDNNWRGVPLSEIYGSQSPWGAPEFPLVTPGFNHAVLYHVPASGLANDRPPKPQVGHDKWDQDHVRMPCSSHSLYPVEASNGESRLKKRWEIIEAALWRPIRNSKDLANAILSYNTKFKGKWRFQSLHKLFEEYLEEEESQYFFDVTLPEIAKLALALPKLIQAPIPLLKQHKNHSVSLSQQQIASLLANAFFCTFPRRNTTKRTSEYAAYPFINFNRLYESVESDHIMEKLKCICHYFRRVSTKAGVGAVTFSRRSVAPRAAPSWRSSDTTIASLPLHVDPDNAIEDADGLIQVDFANKFLGGGVLNHGCVQEEIRFVICPELLISMLFTEVLRPNEALMIIGSERYSKYTGYGHTFHWAGDFKDCTPMDSSHRRRCAVLAIDALPYSSVSQEYRREMITRELNKAWVGFSFASEPLPSGLNYPGVATGNWGCGAFGGTPQLKSLIQMMACAVARRPMAYYTFQDNDIRDDVIGVYNLLSRYNVTVGQLYKYIVQFSATDVRSSHLHAYLHQALRDENEPRPSDQYKPDDSHEPEKMDVSTSSDASAQDLALSNSLHKELTKESPDLFATDSQEEMDESLTEVKVQKDPAKEATIKQNTEKRVTLNRPSRLVEEMEKLDANIKPNTCKSEKGNRPSRLLEEMQKLDAPNTQKTQKSNTLHCPSKNVEDMEKPDDCTKQNTDKSEVVDRPSRFFEEIQKLDDEGGNLNLSVPSSSPFKPNSVIATDSNTTIGNLDTSLSDPTAELKKRVSRKITDYFNKKSI